MRRFPLKFRFSSAICLILLFVLIGAGCTTPDAIGDLPSGVKNIAHRGARSLAPENTLAAIRMAALAGADMVELDVHLTTDGIPVVIHDDTLERTTDIERFYDEWGLKKDVMVSSLTLGWLKTLDAGSWFVDGDPYGTIASGEVTDAMARSYRGEKVPTLKEALALVEDLNLADVEIKQIPRFYEGIVQKVVKNVRQMEDPGRAVISSFDHDVCLRVKRLAPELAAAPLSVDRIAEPGRYVRQLIGGEAWHPSGLVLGLGDGRPVEYPLTNGSDIVAAQRFGVAVNVWTVNGKREMERLIDAGVNGIITDYPQLLKEILDSRRIDSPVEAAGSD